MSQATVVLDIASNGDATDLIDLSGTIIFGLSFDVAPVASVTGTLSVMVGDCALSSQVNAGNGITFFTMNNKDGGTYQIDFPAGLKLFKGLSCAVNANGHGAVAITIDHA